MTTFTIDTENNITAHATPEEAAATPPPFDSFSSQQEFAELAKSWPAERLAAIWNSLPGVQPIKKFKNHNAAATRIWERIQGLGAPEQPEQPERRKAERKAKAGAQAAKGAPAKAKTTKKATAAKNAPKAKKAAKAQEAAGPREGSKTAQVVAMLQRKNGATLAEIMDKMAWQKHTVRGFMAGAMKKAGFTVESFKPEGGERTYRINQ
ncbi:MAG: DUF3489 domain-containing protein [Bryobacteraceae bacterium]